MSVALMIRILLPGEPRAGHGFVHTVLTREFSAVPLLRCCISRTLDCKHNPATNLALPCTIALAVPFDCTIDVAVPLELHNSSCSKQACQQQGKKLAHDVAWAAWNLVCPQSLDTSLVTPSC